MRHEDNPSGRPESAMLLQSHCSDEEDWRFVLFSCRTLNYTPCLVFVEHSVCHELSSVLVDLLRSLPCAC